MVHLFHLKYPGKKRDCSPTWISSHLMSFSTSVWPSSMNSSCWTTSEKCFWEKSSAACIRSRQLWVSAKSRMPRQLEGSSWLSRKSQHALFTPGENKCALLRNCTQIYCYLLDRNTWWNLEGILPSKSSFCGQRCYNSTWKPLIMNKV